MVIPVSVFLCGTRKALEKQMAARDFPCGHQISCARAQSGRCQQAHHQFIALESFAMGFSLAANDPARNRICATQKAG
jgi:hypothetical protein